MNTNLNVVSIRETIIEEFGNWRMHWASSKDVDWLSGENTGVESPWHYSKLLPGRFCLGWLYNRISVWSSWCYFDDSLKFADFILSDGHDDKEAY